MIRTTLVQKIQWEVFKEISDINFPKKLNMSRSIGVDKILFLKSNRDHMLNGMILQLHVSNIFFFLDFSER